MLVSRRAAAQQPQDLRPCIPALVPLPRQNGNRISTRHVANLAVNTNSPNSVRDVINFLRLDMIMLLCAGARTQPRLRQALVGMNLRVAQSDKAATATEAHPRLILNQLVIRGAGSGAKRSVHCTARLRLSMYCSPCFPLRSTLTVLDRPGEFASRILRREYCQEQENSSRCGFR